MSLRPQFNFRLCFRLSCGVGVALWVWQFVYYVCLFVVMVNWFSKFLWVSKRWSRSVVLWRHLSEDFTRIGGRRCISRPLYQVLLQVLTMQISGPDSTWMGDCLRNLGLNRIVSASLQDGDGRQNILAHNQPLSHLSSVGRHHKTFPPKS